MPLESPDLCPKQQFTPCITAMDLTTDQMKRNYSSDDLLRWDRVKNPLPPMAPMRGYGRYRTAECADPEWRLQYFKRQVKGIERLEGMTANLDMQEMTGMSPEEWQVLTGSGPRTASTISTQSLQTTPSASNFEAGTCITRGFSQSSSSRGSQSGLTHERKSSTLSTMNIPSAIDSPSVYAPLRRTTTLLSEGRSSGPLSTIEELQSNMMMTTEVRVKIEVPCEFSDGDPENAVVSDVDDDEGWADVADTNPSKKSAITQIFKEDKKVEPPPHIQWGLARVRTSSNDKKRNRATTAALDRSKTIRATKPDLKRKQSKTKKHERGRSEAKIDIKKSAQQVAESADTSSSGLEIHVANPIREQIRLKPSKETALNGLIDACANLDLAGNTIQPPRPARSRSTTVVMKTESNVAINS